MFVTENEIILPKKVFPYLRHIVILHIYMENKTRIISKYLDPETSDMPSMFPQSSPGGYHSSEIWTHPIVF